MSSLAQKNAGDVRGAMVGAQQAELSDPGDRTGARREPMSAAYFWLVLFLVVYCARPEDWIPGLHILPLAKITGLFALVAFIASAGQSGRGVARLPREMVYLFLLLVQLGLAAIFSFVWRGGAVNQVLDFAKVVLIMPLVVLAVTTLARLRRLLFLQAACVAMIAVIALVKSRLVTGRLEGTLNGIYSNPNDLAFAMALTFPFCFAFLLRTRSGWRKAFWALAMIAMSYALLLTASRGGILAMVIGGSVSLWEFGLRGRRLHLVVLAVVIGVAVLIFGGRRLEERFEALANPSKDPTAYATAQLRREMLWRSLVVTAEHPLFGVGPGNFQVISGSWRDTHNSYTQMSSEAGVAALILYLMILWRTRSNIRRARQLASEQQELQLWVGALNASFLAFLIGSFFANVAYHFFPYFLVAYASVLPAIASADDAAQREASSVAREARLKEDIYGQRERPQTTWTAR